MIEKFIIAKGNNTSINLFLGLDRAYLVSGEVRGVQRCMRDLSSQSLYINCRNHKLALVFTHLLKKIKLFTSSGCTSSRAMEDISL